MNLYTPVEVVSSMPLLSQENNLLLMGSCFASEMGQRLVDAKFRCDVNPYGVLYNPFSISAALREIIAGRCYNENDIFHYNRSVLYWQHSKRCARPFLQRSRSCIAKKMI